MLLSCFILMRQSTRAKINAVEFIGMRCGFSIYTGWVTAATFLNLCLVLKSYGVFGDSYSDSNDYEEPWTIVFMWIAFVVFNLIQAAERNPLYGAVFIWTLFAIWDNVSQKYFLETLAKNLKILTIIHCSLVGIFSGYLVYEKFTGTKV